MSWRQIVDNETDPAKLREYIYGLQEMNEFLINSNQKLREEKAKRDQEQIKLEDQLCKFKKRMFGKSSEKSSSSRSREDKEETLTLQSKSLAPPPKEEEKAEIPEQVDNRKMTLEELAEIAVSYGYSKDSDWEEIKDFYDESTEYDLFPRKVIKRKIRRFKYRLKASKGTDNEVIVTADNKIKLVPGCSYSTDFALEIVADKYIYHNALTRQCRKFEEIGLEIYPKTLYSLIFYVYCYLESVSLAIKNQVLSNKACVHVDETRWPINNKKQDDGQMWVLSNQAGSYYQFEPTRSGKIAKELLAQYSGPVLTDGYSGYSWLKNNPQYVHAHCWFHARREFKDIESNYPKECDEILRLMRKLFRIEKKAKTFEDLKKDRKDKSSKIIDEIEAWLIETKKKARSESYLLKAINYCMNHWEGLTKFLEDVNIPLTNNEAERTIRQAVMGRKNFHGSRTINGADVASVMYTIIESCKKVELNPKAYIKYAVMKKIQGEEPLTPLDYARSIRSN